MIITDSATDQFDSLNDVTKQGSQYTEGPTPTQLV